MNQDRRGSREYIVGVELVDREVVRRGVGGVVADGGDGDVGAVWGLEVVAGVEVGGIDP